MEIYQGEPLGGKINIKDGEGYLHLTYDGLHAYEISALQSHETRIQQLERENAELKRQLQQLNS